MTQKSVFQNRKIIIYIATGNFCFSCNIQQLSEINNISDPSLLNQALYKLGETFDDITKNTPEVGRKFTDAGGDVEKMQKAIQDFNKEASVTLSAKRLAKLVFSLSVE